MKTLHTIYTNFAKRVFFLLFTLIIGGGSALGATWKWTASNVNELGSNTSNVITLNSKEWTTNRSSGTNQNQLQSNCIQIGAKDAAQTITLKSNAFTGKILSVAVECASYNSYHSVSISVGGTSYLSATPTPKWTTVDIKTGTGESSGEIQISFSKNNNSARALYLKSITIEYDESSIEDDEPVSSCGWVATDINNLSSTDLVVITMTNSSGTYAMSNDKGTSAAPSAKQVTVSDNILDGDIDDNIKWNVSNNNGTLTIYPNGTNAKWLYCTNTNNGVRVGTGDAKQFTLKSGYLYEDGTTDARYIGVYNSQDWRCYTSINSNIEDQTLKFYKYVPCGPTETTITLHPNGGTPNENQEITTEEESYTLPECPFSRTGYTFDGWATSADGSVVYADKATIDDLNGTAVNLYAKWTPIQYDITYNLYGGTNHASNPANYTIETPTITLQKPTKNGYTFDGWYKENTFKTKVTEITKGSTGDISLYAKWTPTSYTITYTGLEGATHSNPTTYTIESETITFTAPSERVGYNFICWTPASIEKGSTGNQTVTAFWTAKPLTNHRTLCTYDIVLKNNYVDDDSKDGHTTITATHTSFSTANKPAAREGYEIEGYYAEPECTIKVADNNGNLMDNVTNYTDAGCKWIGGETILYTKWTGRTYTVTLDDNGGSGGSGTITATYGSPMPAITLPTRTGYTFNGYWTGKTTQSTQYYDANGNSLKNWDKAGNTTILYALWTANTNTSYVVKHYKEQLDGTYLAEADDTDNYTGTTASSVTPEVKSYEGFTAPSTQTVSIAADGSTVVTYQYTRNSYNLSWDVNSGDALTGEYTSGSVKYGASITQPNTPTRIGYTFANWSPEVPATMPAGDATYTAQWQLIQYTITWSVGGSTTTSIVSVETPLSLPTSPANNALGCCADAFIGWSVYAQPTKEQVFNDVANAPEIDENKTFHAVFATTTLTEGSATATFNEMGYTNAEKVTEIALGDGEGHGDATILFAKEQSAPNYPAYYTASGALHAYAKNTITINSTSATSTITNVQFTFAAKEDGSNTISANVETYADGTWTGSAESVVFTIGGETGHRKITSITVTTQAVEQYTNYVTKCTYGISPTLGDGTITYNSGDGIDVRCEQTSAMNSAATLTFPNAADLTCPITLTASAGFLISTSKSNDAGYQTSLTVSPYKSGSAQAGKLRTIYVRANATGKTENYSGTITISGGEVTEQTITVNANVNCQGYTLTLKDHLGNTIGTPTSHYEGDIIELPTELEEDACSENYTFDGWSTAQVEYGSLIYNKVSFLYTMPAEDVTLYPVYQCNKTADYHRVTSDLGLGDVDGNNWAGDYLIAYNDQIFADGRIGGKTNENSIGKANVRSEDFSEYIKNNVVPASYGNTYYITLESVSGGYLLKTQDGKYNYHTNNSDNDLSASESASTAGKYTINVEFISDSDIRLCLSGNALGSVFRYGCGQSGCFFRFYKDCGGNSIYLYKKSHLYTTSLICGTIEIQESNIVVTSTKDQSVKVSVPVKLTSPYNDAVAISGANVNAFSVITKENVLVNTDEVVNVELIYSPQAYDQLDTETITLTATNGATTSFQITGRSLPETFAIVAKVGNNWYALPSQGLNSETTPVGYPVKVDNNDNPIAVTSLPTKAEWALRNVYKVNGSNDRFAANGENLVFVNTENKTLYANNGNANIQTYAEYTNYATNNPERYEWVPTTTDLTNYTLKNVGRDKDLSINVNATFGTHASNVASSNLRFLPINATYTPFDMQVVEWYPTKVLVQTEAVLTSVSAIVGDIEVASPVVTKKGGKLYEISGLPLESNPTKILTISYDTYSCSKVIPIIISRATKSVTDAPFTTLTTSVYNYSDLVVRDGATLTINGTKQAPDKFVNVTIYPTAKIVVPENKQLSVYSLTFFGGIGEIYDGSAYTLNKYGVPQLSLKGTLGKTIPQIDYIMRVDLEQMYQVGVPYDVNLEEITYWDGTSIELGTALYVSAYDGAARARLDWDNTWQWEVNFAEKVLKAGIGYTISAEPQVAGDTYSILRMPMKNNINSGNTETQKATINVTAHGMSDENLTDNHKGWNYLSNPYMAAISGAEADSKLVVGYLRETGTGPWEWVDDTYRYVTIPHNDGEDYYQQKFSEATLLPFKSFFLQIATDGELSFALASRLNAPMRHLQQQENAPREVEFELLLSNDAQSDNTGLLISEEFTPAYEINADLEKMTGTMSVYTIYNGYQLAYNALSPLNAMEEIPLGYVVPTTGEYTFNLDERGDLDDIEHIYLLDHDSSITTDLMEDIYTFTATEKKNDHRFAISVILKAEEEEETPTHLETLEWESDHPYKFIYQDKMYILRNGVIYDAMGKQVQTINK